MKRLRKRRMKRHAFLVVAVSLFSLALVSLSTPSTFVTVSAISTAFAQPKPAKPNVKKRDEKGRPLETTEIDKDGNFVNKTYKYHPNGKTASETIETYPAGAVDPKQPKSRQEKKYDQEGKPTEQIDESFDFDVNGNVTGGTRFKIKYDENGKAGDPQIEKWNPETKKWASFSLLTVDLAEQGETFTGVVIAESEGKRDLLAEGDQIVFTPAAPNAGGSFEGEVVSVEGGQVKIPPFVKEVGNVFVVGTLIRKIDRGARGETPDPKTCPKLSQHVEVVHVPEDVPTKIAHASELFGTGQPFRVEGQNLNQLHNAAFEGADGQRFALGQPAAASSLQQVYLPRSLPAGKYRFVAENEKGQKLSAPRESTNDTQIQLQGSRINYVGERGTITVTTNVDGMVVLEGGEPQITLEQYSVKTRAGAPATIPFRANAVGPYRVRATLKNPEDVPPDSHAPHVDAKVEPAETRYDANRNETQVKCPLRVVDEKGEAVEQVAAKVAVAHPQGVEYGEVTTDEKGRASFLCTLPGKVAKELIEPHVYRVLGHEWNKQPQTPQIEEIGNPPDGPLGEETEEEKKKARIEKALIQADETKDKLKKDSKEYAGTDYLKELEKLAKERRDEADKAVNELTPEERKALYRGLAEWYRGNAEEFKKQSQKAKERAKDLRKQAAAANNPEKQKLLDQAGQQDKAAEFWDKEAKNAEKHAKSYEDKAK